MDWLEFTSSIVATVIWPFAAVALALIFRRSLKELIQSVRMLRGEGFGASIEAGFGEQVANVSRRLDEAHIPEADSAETMTKDGETPSDRQGPDTKRLHWLGALAPKAAILESWRVMENELFRASGIRGTRRIVAVGMGVRLFELLVNNEIMSQELADTIIELRRLYLSVKYGIRLRDGEISAETAHEFVDASVRIVTFLRRQSEDRGNAKSHAS